MFKDLKEGETHYCDHPTKNTSGICDECYDYLVERSENKSKKYKVFTTDNNGNGYVMQIGEFDDVEDIKIRVGTFAKDVVISIEERKN